MPDMNLNINVDLNIIPKIEVGPKESDYENALNKAVEQCKANVLTITPILGECGKVVEKLTAPCMKQKISFENNFNEINQALMDEMLFGNAGTTLQGQIEANKMALDGCINSIRDALEEPLRNMGFELVELNEEYDTIRCQLEEAYGDLYVFNEIRKIDDVWAIKFYSDSEAAGFYEQLMNSRSIIESDVYLHKSHGEHTVVTVFAEDLEEHLDYIIKVKRFQREDDVSVENTTLTELINAAQERNVFIENMKNIAELTGCIPGLNIIKDSRLPKGVVIVGDLYGQGEGSSIIFFD